VHPSTKLRKGLRERIEDNIILAILAAGVASGATVAAVMGFLNTQEERIVTEKYDAKIADLHGRITGINRSLAGAKTIDVRRMLVDQVALETALASSYSRYFLENHYCVADNISEFQYERTTETGLMEQSLGPNSLPQFLASTLANFTVDLWKGSSTPISGRKDFKYLFPFVAVEVISKQDLEKNMIQMGHVLFDIKDSNNAKDKADATHKVNDDTEFATLYSKVTAIIRRHSISHRF
jgi:hypothetical protein